MVQILFILLVVTLFLIFKFLFHITHTQSLYISAYFILSLYSSRGIIAATISLMLKKTIDEVFQPPYFYLILGLTVILSLIIWIIARYTIASKEKLAKLLDNNSHLRFLFIFEIIMIIYLLFINDGRHWEMRPLWYTLLYLISSIVCKCTFLFVFNHTIRISVLLEYELNTKQLQEQLTRQLQHYRSYQKYTESFRQFKHDYKKMMTMVKALLDNNENEKAIHLLDNIHDTMQKTVLVHKLYSNHYLIDAILQDAANTCAENHIQFSATVSLPTNIEFSELNLIRVFTNIIQNAVEACCNTPVNNRFIHLIGYYKDDWIFVHLTNRYNGNIILMDNEIKTTKQEKENHGLGLKIVRDIVEKKWGGLVLMDANREKKEFSIKIHVPISSFLIV